METVRDSGLIVEHRSAWDEIPNGNDPVVSAPGTVGPPTAVPGDPHGVEVVGVDTAADGPGRPRVSPWSGWPADWATPNWFGQVELLTDTAWAALDLNGSIFASMPPYLVGNPGVSSDWINNPDPDLYTGWQEFAKQLAWDYQLGEAFILATSYYANGWPARFHVVPPWYVNAEIAPDGRRRYTIGERDVTADMLHIRYKSSVGDAHGHGPLEAGAARLVAANALARYASNLAASGGIPSSVLVHPSNLNKTQAEDLQAAWIEARMSRMGIPAVLSGGVDFRTLSISPRDMALLELAQFNESRIAVLLGVPPFLLGLPSGGDSMTYSNVVSLFDYHWRAGLRPKATAMMEALSNWALPRGTTVEVNRDEYVKPGPLERAQTWQILITLGVLTVEQVQEIERYSVSAPSNTLTSGVLQ